MAPPCPQARTAIPDHPTSLMRSKTVTSVASYAWLTIRRLRQARRRLSPASKCRARTCRRRRKARTGRLKITSRAGFRRSHYKGMRSVRSKDRLRPGRCRRNATLNEEMRCRRSARTYSIKRREGRLGSGTHLGQIHLRLRLQRHHPQWSRLRMPGWSGRSHNIWTPGHIRWDTATPSGCRKYRRRRRAARAAHRRPTGSRLLWTRLPD